MRELDEDPAPVIEAAAVQTEAHFKERDLEDTWACVSVFAPDALTEGNFKADLFERFNADYRRFSRLMDRFLPDPRALNYTDRLARLTEIRAYVRAQFLREDADADWTEIGAKVKKLVEERISANVRELMKPVSILDQDFEQKIAALPHDESRASIMEHARRRPCCPAARRPSARAWPRSLSERRCSIRRPRRKPSVPVVQSS